MMIVFRILSGGSDTQLRRGEHVYDTSMGERMFDCKHTIERMFA